jgi:HSP20 family protein
MEYVPIKFKLMRRERRLSQDEIARQLGVSRQTIFAIENGRSEPSLSLALKICSLLDMAVEEVFSQLDEDSQENQLQEENERKEVTNMTPNLVPFSPLNDITNLHREIDRFFEDALTTPRDNYQLNAMNVTDNGDSFEVVLAIPGYKEDEIDIEAGDDFLTIKGEKKEGDKQGKKNYLKREFSYNSFERSIVLPSEIQSNKVEAAIEHGTLTLKLPKVAPVQPKVSKVKINKK